MKNWKYATILMLTAAHMSVLSGAATAQDSAAMASESDAIGEIVVTAQRRETRILDVPFSLSAVSGEMLEEGRLNQLQDLQFLAPNVRLFARANSALENNISIRGVVTQDFGNPNVITYIDGVPTSPLLLNAGLFDLERVEVLRGPAGTLYGRRSTAGAINIISRRPGDEARGFVEGAIGSYGSRELIASASGPITDTVGASIAVFNQSQDGWQQNAFNGTRANPSEITSIRSRFAFTPSDATEIDLVLGYLNNEVAGFTRRPADTPNDEPGAYRNDQQSITSVESYYGNVSLRQDLPLGTLNALASFNTSENLQLIDFDYFGVTDPSFNFRAPGDGEEYTAEVRWSVFDREVINWVVGMFYLSSEGSQGVDFFVPFTDPLPPTTPFDEENFAVFGEVTATLGGFEIALGARYDLDENTDQSGNVAESEEFLPRVSARYDLSDSASIYATYSTGYRSGGSNIEGTFPPGSETFDPENVDNYEVGFKASLLGGALYLAGSVYQMDFTDLQARNRVFPPGETAFLEFIDNTGEARNRGFELEADWRASDKLTIGGGVSYTDFEYTDFISSGVDFTGNKVQDSVDWTGVFRMSYEQPLSDDATAYIRTDVSYTGEVVFDQANAFVQDPYTIVNLRAGVKLRQFDISAYARNLFDEGYFIEFSPGGVRRPDGMGGLMRVNGGTSGVPFTGGVALRYTF